MNRARPSDRSVIGFLLVALGIMFLLDTTDLLALEFGIVGTFWPALLIAWGVWGLITSRLVLRLWSVLLVLVGVLFLLSTLEVWDWDLGELWPVLLVIVGLALLFGSRVRPRRRWRGRRSRRGPLGPENGGVRVINTGPSPSGSGATTDFRASHIFGGGREQVTSQEFRGGEVSAVFGGMELDLRDAALAEGRAILDATVICGGLELRVPNDWKVNIQTNTLFGGVENKRTQPRSSDAKGELTITGAVICGGIEVKD